MHVVTRFGAPPGAVFQIQVVEDWPDVHRHANRKRPGPRPRGGGGASRVAPRGGDTWALRRVAAPRLRRWHRLCVSANANGRGDARRFSGGSQSSRCSTAWCGRGGPATAGRCTASPPTSTSAAAAPLAMPVGWRGCCRLWACWGEGADRASARFRKSVKWLPNTRRSLPTSRPPPVRFTRGSLKNYFRVGGNARICREMRSRACSKLLRATPRSRQNRQGSKVRELDLAGVRFRKKRTTSQDIERLLCAGRQKDII